MKLTQEQTDKIFNAVTANGCREMEELRFNYAANEAIEESNRLEKLVMAKIADFINNKLEYEEAERKAALSLQKFEIAEAHRQRYFVLVDILRKIDSNFST